MSELNIPQIELNDGNLVPQLGVGLWRLDETETERIVSEALELGYRHFDTASFYENEAAVGRALAASGVPRDELFITTKLWNTDHRDAHAAFQASLDRLGLERVDLYLVHWPVPTRGTAVAAWRALVELVGSPQCNSIGVANFEIEHLTELLRETGVVPAVNQIELHPLHQRNDLREFCAQRDITVEAWGPFAQGKTNLFERSVITEAAEAHGKTPAQVVLRWHLQHGNVVFPKTTNAERLAENASIFDFALTDIEIAKIDGIEAAHRVGGDPFTFTGE
jgi:2,5-diketo-D-gluconate reductase A